MAADSDRDILIRLDQKVSDIHRDMTQPEGRVPKLELKVDEHAAHLNRLAGSQSMAKWFIGGIMAAVLAVGVALLTHLLGGK